MAYIDDPGRFRRNKQIGSYFERVQGGDLQRKKIALVATAHHLARVMLGTLRSGAVCRWHTF